MVHLCNQDSIVIRTLLYAVFKLAWGKHAHTNTLHSKSYCLDHLLIAKLIIGSGQSKRFSFPIILWVYLATSSFFYIWHDNTSISLSPDRCNVIGSSSIHEEETKTLQD